MKRVWGWQGTRHTPPDVEHGAGPQNPPWHSPALPSIIGPAAAAAGQGGLGAGQPVNHVHDVPGLSSPVTQRVDRLGAPTPAHARPRGPPALLLLLAGHAAAAGQWDGGLAAIRVALARFPAVECKGRVTGGR